MSTDSNDPRPDPSTPRPPSQHPTPPSADRRWVTPTIGSMMCLLMGVGLGVPAAAASEAPGSARGNGVFSIEDALSRLCAQIEAEAAELRARAERLQDDTLALEARNALLEARAAELEARAADLAGREAQLEEREAAVATGQSALAAWSRHVSDREAALEEAVPEDADHGSPGGGTTGA